MIAHVGGLPVEELLPLVLASGAAAGPLLARLGRSALRDAPLVKHLGQRPAGARRAGHVLERREPERDPVISENP